jgi:hypothetical protein
MTSPGYCPTCAKTTPVVGPACLYCSAPLPSPVTNVHVLERLAGPVLTALADELTSLACANGMFPERRDDFKAVALDALMRVQARRTVTEILDGKGSQ